MLKVIGKERSHLLQSDLLQSSGFCCVIHYSLLHLTLNPFLFTSLSLLFLLTLALCLVVNKTISTVICRSISISLLSSICFVSLVMTQLMLSFVQTQKKIVFLSGVMKLCGVSESTDHIFNLTIYYSSLKEYLRSI